MSLFNSRKPNSKNCTLWSDYFNLTNPKYYIRGLFNYDAYEGIIQPKKYVILKYWEFLLLF